MICARCGAGPFEPAFLCPECHSDPRLDARYRLEDLLGQGTHGMTYRALDPDERPVAVKMVNLGAGLDGDKRAHLDREVAVLRQIEHARVPAVLDDFTVRSGMTRYRCIVQTFVDGEHLGAYIGRRRPSVSEVLAMLAELANLVAWLHALAPPIIHRDIKPQNVLRRHEDGALVLIDFGSVRDTIVETLGGTMGVGTAGYMAPEQVIGDVRPASDVFALGAMTIELLTRQPPHTLREADGRLRWPSDAFPPGVVAFVDRMVDPDPDARPDAEEVTRIARRLAHDPDDPVFAPRAVAVPVAAPVAAEPRRPEFIGQAPLEADPDGPRFRRHTRWALNLMQLGTVVAAVSSPFNASVTAWAGLLSAPVLAYLTWVAGHAEGKTARRVGISGLVVLIGMTIAVNALGIGPLDAISIFPFFLLPYLFLVWRPFGRARAELDALDARALGYEVDPVGPAPADRTVLAPADPTAPAPIAPGSRFRAHLLSMGMGLGMFGATAALVDEGETLMVSGPILAAWGLLTAWMGRRAGASTLVTLGRSVPVAAIGVFLVIALGGLSPSDARDVFTVPIGVYGAATLLVTLISLFRRS